MHNKRFFALVLAAVLLLTACGGPAPAETEPTLVRYDHPIGVSLSMAEGFEVTQVEGVLGCYQGTEANVRFAEELFVSLEALGISPEISLEEYAQLILDAYGLEGEPLTDSRGNVYIAYSQVVQDQDVAYYAYFSRNDVAFWTTTFMCFAQIAPELEDDFSLWASTIELPAEAVTEPAVPTEPRAELEKLDQDKLMRTINWSMEIDWLGRSFTSADLTEEELRDLTLWLSSGVYSGFASETGADLRSYETGKYLGREDFALEDLFCVCGEQVGAYSADRDEMDWIGDHDHREHYCRAVNYVQDMWQQGDAYYVTMYKLFPDIEENASGSLGYYPTIQDAQAQTNVLFHAASTEELNEHTATLSVSLLHLYTLRYEKQENGDFVLVEYTIG